MQKFYFTFGFGQPMKQLLDYVEIIAKDIEQAREEMVKNFNCRWSMQYTEEEFEGQPEKWSYTKKLTINLIK